MTSRRKRGAVRDAVRETGWILGRSLFPFAALALILGTVLWGPWVTLGLTLVWWRVVVRFA